MFTGKDLANYCKQIYSNRNMWAYWYGTYGNKCTLEKYKGKKRQYPAHYTDDRYEGYMLDIEQHRYCADCVGMIKSFFWTGGVYGGEPKYATNHCPDTSANGMISLCKTQGDIKSIPDIPGIVVWKNGHIGVYVGDGYTVEMKGFNYDCIRAKVSNGNWKKWGMLPKSMISYDEITPTHKNVTVTGGSVYIRTAPSKENGKILGVAHKGDILPYQGVISENGWYLIIYNNKNGWISGKYSVI